MSTSNNFSTTNQFIVFRIRVSQTAQSIANNTSNQTVEVQFRRTNRYSGTPTHGTGTVYCQINGVNYTQGVVPAQKVPNDNSWTTWFSRNVTINHKDDGSRAIWVQASLTHNVLNASAQGFTATLETIPRYARFESADNFNDEQNPRMSYNNPLGLTTIGIYKFCCGFAVNSQGL
jgi:hypothetical protein